jgi:hypothetical protein
LLSAICLCNFAQAWTRIAPDHSLSFTGGFELVNETTHSAGKSFVTKRLRFDAVFEAVL